MRCCRCCAAIGMIICAGLSLRGTSDFDEEKKTSDGNQSAMPTEGSAEKCRDISNSCNPFYLQLEAARRVMSPSRTGNVHGRAT